MYTFQLNDQYISVEEKEIFSNYLSFMGLDQSIWDVFHCLFESSDNFNRPMLLRTYEGSELVGLALVVKCSRYGKSLFNNKILSGLINLFRIPFFLWIKFGCCMDMMSNPGFVKEPARSDEIFKEMIRYLQRKNLLTIVNDYTHNNHLYTSASVLPALPHALIDVSDMSTITTYLEKFKNIKKKLRVFANKGGEYKQVSTQLNQEQLKSLKECFIITSEKSVFYLPYQDIYLNSAIKTSSTSINNVYYFVAYLNNSFIGYQAAVQTGKHLNALHGAFDRNLRTTYHAYDILFVKMTEFAIQNGLQSVDFGAVLNMTKQKMVNRSIEMSYFLMSKYSLVRLVFNLFLKLTRIQSKNQLKFRE